MSYMCIICMGDTYEINIDYDVICFDIVDDKIEITIRGCKL